MFVYVLYNMKLLELGLIKLGYTIFMTSGLPMQMRNILERYLLGPSNRNDALMTEEPKYTNRFAGMLYGSQQITSGNQA